MEKQFEYRLITGKDDSTFCERVTKYLEEGYCLYGSPSGTFNGKDVIAAQAVILPQGKNQQKKSSRFVASMSPEQGRHMGVERRSPLQK